MKILLPAKTHWLSSRLLTKNPTWGRYLSASASLHSTRTTTVERGNAFEQRSLDLLGQTMSMSLTRVGGKEDGGIDLVGWWWLPYDTDNPNTSNLSSSPETRRRIRVIGQCKAEKKKMGPKYVRELEGVLFRFSAMSEDSPLQLFPLERTTSPVVALLISQSPFTKSTILRAHSSPIPFFLLHLPPIEDVVEPSTEDSPTESANIPVDSVGSAVGNPALIGTQGLLKGQLEIRWERHSMGLGGRPALWWNYEKLQSYVPPMELETLELDQSLEADSQPA